jgi:hypothetical protein
MNERIRQLTNLILKVYGIILIGLGIFLIIKDLI